MESFEGRTAVITGAASGIGFGLAEAFASEGARVVMADVEKDALDGAVGRLEGRGFEVLGVVTDTRIKDSVRALADRAVEAFGQIHILCNNAGVASYHVPEGGRGVWAVPDADWQWVMGVNFHGILNGIQVFVPLMLAHGEPGHIVNTSSIAAFWAGGGTYGASKHATLSLTETLYLDLQAAGSAIGASVLCPGLVDTNIGTAERNRPAELDVEVPPISESALRGPRGFTSSGMAPSVLAQHVLRSIREDRLYILPHPALDDSVRQRLDHVIARGGPAVRDWSEPLGKRNVSASERS